MRADAVHYGAAFGPALFLTSLSVAFVLCRKAMRLGRGFEAEIKAAWLFSLRLKVEKDDRRGTETLEEQVARLDADDRSPVGDTARFNTGQRL
jgi:hypothetical protein